MRSIQFKHLLLGLLLAVVGSQTVMAQTKIQLVSYNSNWKYDDSGANLGTAWIAPGYNDSAWASGPSGLGFAANESLLSAGTVQTIIKRYITGSSGPQVITYYFRTRFNFTNSTQGVTLVATNAIDDGAAFYLNGMQITRVALAATANYTNLALRADDITQHGLEVFTIPASMLVPGTNVLAVELHQGSATSSDNAFSMSLWATLPAGGPAIIVTQPTNQTVSLGSQVLFHADVAGTPPYSFQWRKDGAIIPGATSQDYIIPSASLADGGRYSFSVTNATGGAVSSNALLIITAPPAYLLPFNHSWKYLLTGTDPGTAWRAPNFNDSGWLSGPGPLGYETAAIPVPVATTFTSNNELTYYFRTKFVFTNNPNDFSLVFSNELDDGAVFYINDVEVLRVGVDNGPATFATTASRTIGEAAMEIVTIPATALSIGTNTIAVEVHQVNRTSTDLVFGLGLTAVGLPPTPLAITNEPVDLIVEEQKPAVFTVGVSGNAPRYQWFKNNVLIPGATGSSFIIPGATTNDNGLYHVVVSNVLSIVQSRMASLTVLADTNAPILLSADGLQDPFTVIATYSERVVPSLATNISNYTITNTAGSTLTINKAVLSNGTNVILTTTAERTAGANYLLFARNIRDVVTASNSIPPNSVVPITSRIQIIESDFEWKYYDPYPGIDPLDLGTSWRTEAFSDAGWATGPAAFIYDPSNDELPYEQGSVLSQGSTTKYFRLAFPYTATPAGAVLTLRHLVDDGAVFYINGQEVFRHNLPVGQDYLTPGASVGTASLLSTNISPDALRVGNNLLAVELHGTAPNDLDFVFGMEMSAVVQSFGVGPIIITGGPESKTVAEGSDVSFTANAVAATTFQWFRNNVAIPGATNSVYTIQNVPLSLNSNTFRVDASRTGATTRSSTNALLRVITDATAPRLFSAVGDGTKVTITFSERIDTTSGAVASNYSVTNRTGPPRTVNSALVSSNTVTLTLNGATRLGDVVVVKGVKDASSGGNVIISNSAVTVSFSRFLVPMAAVWKYDESGTDLGTTWRATAFDDTAWPSGAALIAFEDVSLTEPIRTRLADPRPASKITTYYRTHFNFPGMPAGGTFAIRHYIDDGAVFYLNGQEFYRVRMPVQTVLFDTPGNGGTGVGDAASEGPITVTLPNIIVGDNVLAVEVHQNSGSSSDIVMGAELTYPGVDGIIIDPPVIRPSIFIEKLAAGPVRLTWNAPDFRLEEASNVTGPWTTVVGATSPRLITPVANGTRFYRLAK